MTSARNPEHVRSSGVLCLLVLAGTAPSLWADPNQITAVRPAGDRFQAVARMGLAKRDTDSVVKYFDKAIADAPSNAEKAQLSLAFAGALERTAGQTGQREWLNQSEQYYLRAMTSPEKVVSFKAASNYCAQLVRGDRPGDAVKLMTPIIPKIVADASLSATAKSRSLYNYGKALELSGDAPAAFDTLTRAMDVDPTFEKAAQSAAALAWNAVEPAIGIRRLTGVTRRQLAAARFDDMATHLRTALAVGPWARDATYPDLVRQLVRYLTAAKVGPQAFRDQWRDLLVQARDRERPDTVSRAMLEQIAAVYEGLLRVQFIPAEAEGTFRAWRAPEDRVLFAQFLRMVGGHFYRVNDRKNALACCSCAWSLDTSNLQAGLDAADILLLDQKATDNRLDPQRTLLAEFVHYLFEEKGGAYLGRDSNLILKLHIILGTIFESQDRWGPRSAAASAYYQWERARRALENSDANMREEFGTRVEERFKRAQAMTR